MEDVYLLRSLGSFSISAHCHPRQAKLLGMSLTNSSLPGTLPEIVYKCAKLDQVAAVFDAEKITYTFQNIRNEVSFMGPEYEEDMRIFT